MANADVGDPLETAIARANSEFETYCNQADEWSSGNNIAEPQYHYTDAAGLHGMLCNKSFRATSTLHLNDPSELEHGLSLVRSALEDLSKASARIKKFVDANFSVDGQGNFAREFYYYSVSFSKRSNDLAQWRAYADSGKGVCIKFSKEAFAEIDQSAQGYVVTPLSVQYELDAIKEKMLSYAKEADRIFCEALKGLASAQINQNAEDKLWNQLARKLIGKLMLLVVTAKHDAYKHEDETRLLIYRTRGALEPRIEN